MTRIDYRAGLAALALVWAVGAQVFTGFGIAPELALPSARVTHILALSVPLHFCYCATAFFLESIQRVQSVVGTAQK